MQIKNISKNVINLESGACASGDTAEATFKEVEFLCGMNRAEIVPTAPTAPKPAKPK